MHWCDVIAVLARAQVRGSDPVHQAMLYLLAMGWSRCCQRLCCQSRESDYVIWLNHRVIHMNAVALLRQHRLLWCPYFTYVDRCI